MLGINDKRQDKNVFHAAIDILLLWEYNAGRKAYTPLGAYVNGRRYDDSAYLSRFKGNY